MPFGVVEQNTLGLRQVLEGFCGDLPKIWTARGDSVRVYLSRLALECRFDFGIPSILGHSEKLIVGLRHAISERSLVAY